jgi:hypothetical protein
MKPVWWVLESEAPDGMKLDVVYTRPEPDWLDKLLTYPQMDDVFSGSRYVGTATISLKGRSWPVESYVLKAAGDDELRLHAVLASEPPGFGWWMPSLKDEGLT